MGIFIISHRRNHSPIHCSVAIAMHILYFMVHSHRHVNASHTLTKGARIARNAFYFIFNSTAFCSVVNGNYVVWHKQIYAIRLSKMQTIWNCALHSKYANFDCLLPFWIFSLNRKISITMICQCNFCVHFSEIMNMQCECKCK